jgi:hypothetical protein
MGVGAELLSSVVSEVGGRECDCCSRRKISNSLQCER